MNRFERLQLSKFAFPAMGSPCEIRLFAETAHEAQAAFELGRQEVERLEQRYSRYRSDRILSDMHCGARRSDRGQRLIPVAPGD